MSASGPSRLLLPGLAFKGAVIGCGYATGRELAEFFLPAGPVGGLLGLGTTMLIWSTVCAATFALAHRAGAHDYRRFFAVILGRFWPLFDVVFLALTLLVVSVVAAAAGEIGGAMFGAPLLAGTVAWMGATAAILAGGNSRAAWLFRHASPFLYAIFALFFLFCALQFGDRIMTAFAHSTRPAGWLLAGSTYASYNLIAAVLVLPMLQGLASPREAAIAGLLSGPMAVLPGALFFVAMTAWPADVAAAPLPSDVLLAKLGMPWFRLAFQVMIFIALLETGVALLHSLNERIAAQITPDGGATVLRIPILRITVPVGVMLFSVIVAERVGLVALIAAGYRGLALLLLLIFIVPLLTRGLWMLFRSPRPQALQP
jgi:uncharacterized membrane protein YkvI